MTAANPAERADVNKRREAAASELPFRKTSNSAYWDAMFPFTLPALRKRNSNKKWRPLRQIVLKYKMQRNAEEWKGMRRNADKCREIHICLYDLHDTWECEI